MAYRIIQPPFTLDFSEMSKQDLADYARWFHASIPARLSELESTVRETSGYESWTPTYEPDSLIGLGDWFAAQVDTRPRTDGEMNELRARRPMLAQAANVELTTKTFSLAIDVGMYLARALERAHPQLAWTQVFRDKRDVNYGQPVLSGFGKIVLNPARVVITLAYAFASRERSGSRLREIFDWWSNQVTPMKH